MQSAPQTATVNPACLLCNMNKIVAYAGPRPATGRRMILAAWVARVWDYPPGELYARLWHVVFDGLGNVVCGEVGASPYSAQIRYLNIVGVPDKWMGVFGPQTRETVASHAAFAVRQYSSAANVERGRPHRDRGRGSDNQPLTKRKAVTL